MFSTHLTEQRGFPHMRLIAGFQWNVTIIPNFRGSIAFEKCRNSLCSFAGIPLPTAIFSFRVQYLLMMIRMISKKVIEDQSE